AAERPAYRPVVEDEPLPPVESLADGYGRSKWVAEMLVREAGARGLPGTIYRPGHVTGHSGTGACNPRDFLHTLSLASARAGVVPELSGSIDLTPVDYVSRAIVRLSRDPQCVGGTFHLTNPTVLQLSELVDWLRRQGAGLTVVPYPAWRARLQGE